jgi:hypothetical protein
MATVCELLQMLANYPPDAKLVYVVDGAHYELDLKLGDVGRECTLFLTFTDEKEKVIA